MGFTLARLTHAVCRVESEHRRVEAERPKEKDPGVAWIARRLRGEEAGPRPPSLAWKYKENGERQDSDVESRYLQAVHSTSPDDHIKINAEALDHERRARARRLEE